MTMMTTNMEVGLTVFLRASYGGLTKPQWNGRATVTIPTLQTVMVKHREVKRLASGH